MQNQARQPRDGITGVSWIEPSHMIVYDFAMHTLSFEFLWRI